MSTTKTYDPGLISCTWLGLVITGFGPDEFITAARNEDAYVLTVGTGGEACRSRNQNKSGRVSITLMASALINDALSGALQLDELFGAGVGPLLVKDNLGTSLIAAENAWLVKHPDNGFGKVIGTRVWVLDCERVDIHTGGTIAIVAPPAT